MIKYKFLTDKPFYVINSWHVYQLEHLKDFDKDVICFLFINCNAGEQFLLEIEYININELEEYFFKFSIKKYDDTVDEEEAEYMSRILMNKIEVEAKKIVPGIDLVDFHFYFPNKTDF